MDVFAKYVNPQINIKNVDYHNGVARDYANKHMKLGRPRRNYRKGAIVKIVERDSFDKRTKTKGPFQILAKVKNGYDLVDVNSESGEKVNFHPVPFSQLAPVIRLGVIDNAQQFVTKDIKRIVSHAEIPPNQIENIEEQNGVQTDHLNSFLVEWVDGSQSWISKDDFTDVTI
eukprot:Awhi_evm1s12100